MSAADVAPELDQGAAAPRPGWRERLLAIAVLAVLTGLTYHRTFGNGFVWDDRTLVVGNAAVRSVRTSLAAFRTDMWRLADPLRSPDAYYRPIGIVSFALDEAIAGPRPGWFHLHDLVLHTVNAILLWVLLRRRLGRAAALLAAAWWATLPASAEVVCWISDRFDAEGLLFLLLAFLVQERLPGLRGGTLSAACTLGALLSKETAAVTVAVVLADEILAHRAAWTARWALTRALPHALAVAVYAALRTAAGAPAPLATRSVAELAQDYLTVVGEVSRLMVAPLPLTVTRVYQPYATAALITTAVGLVASGLLLALRRQARVGWVWFAVACAMPALAVRPQGFMAERYVYLPAAGVAIVVGVALDLLRSRAGKRAAVAAIAAMVLVIGMGMLAISRRVPAWKDDRTLFASALEVDPRSWYALFEMGHADAREGRWQEAAQWYRRSLEAGHYDARLLVNAAVAFERSGDLDEAVLVGRMAVETVPLNPRAHYNLAVALARSGQLEQALNEVEAALALAPEYSSARRFAGELAELLRRRSGPR